MKTKMKKLFLFLFILLLSACATNKTINSELDSQSEKFKGNSSSKIVEVLNENYIAASKVQRLNSSPLLDQYITFKAKGDIQTLCEILSDITKLDIKVYANDYQNPISLDYNGTLYNLLEQMASAANFAWEQNGSSIVFKDFITKSFSIVSAAGQMKYDNSITNRSKDSASSGNFGMVSTSDTSMQTAQTTSTSMELDVWTDTLATIKTMLSDKGTLALNNTAGSITVSDRANNIKNIEKYINELNAQLGRQVALTVYVWSLELNNKNDFGINLQTIFQTSNLKIAAGAIADIGVGTMTASILDGKFKDSSMVLKALSEWGNAKQVTSAGGIVMSNQPMPILAVKKTAYLAGINTTQGDYGQTTGMTPGEVTTGFSMTVVPNILEGRKVILQYNINLSNLDDLVSFTSDNSSIQLPQVSTRALNQRMQMKMGQTLVLAGFEQVNENNSSSLGLLAGGKNKSYGRSLLIITIEVESADV